VIVLICGAYFLGRRLFLARVRAISSIYDYVILLIAVAPFLTGFLAYHQWWDYKTVIFLHILTGEIMLITLPFTKLGHMLFFFLYRFFIGSEYSFVRGSRTW
jgi:nitrate reductase gamma subunit